MPWSAQTPEGTCRTHRATRRGGSLREWPDLCCHPWIGIISHPPPPPPGPGTPWHHALPRVARAPLTLTCMPFPNHPTLLTQIIILLHPCTTPSLVVSPLFSQDASVVPGVLESIIRFMDISVSDNVYQYL